jgi:1,4-alpha-glucan branching enzyme
MWLEEYHVDGIRFDGTHFIRTVHGSDGHDLPEGWSLLQWINDVVARLFPGRITIAEDLQNNRWLTKDVGAGGAGFGAQWDAMFVHPIRRAVITPRDEQRSLAAIRDAICYRYNDDAFDRVVYSESHHEVANGGARVPQEISPSDPKGWYARERSTLAAAMVFTSPVTPRHLPDARQCFRLTAPPSDPIHSTPHRRGMDKAEPRFRERSEGEK